MLWENDVFNAHSASMFSIVEEVEIIPLAPFGYLERWQKKVSDIKTKGQCYDHDWEDEVKGTLGSATKASAPVLSLQ